MDIIKTVVPIKIRLVDGEISTLKRKAIPAIGKGKEKVGESAAAPESHLKEVYRRREVLPFQQNTLFTELGHKGMITRFNKATSHLITKVDVDHLGSLPPKDRVCQFQASAVEVVSSLRVGILSYSKSV